MAVILILVLISFIQSSILPVNIVLVILLCRSFIVEDKTNLYLAFSLGLLDALLGISYLGMFSLLYLVMVETVYILKKVLAGLYWIIILPLAFLFTSFYNLLLVPKIEALNFPNMLSLMVLVVPIFLALKYLSERFVPHKDFRLKLQKSS